MHVNGDDRDFLAIVSIILCTTKLGKLSKLDSSGMDGLKQRVKELEELLNKHNVSTTFIARLSVNTP